MKIAQKLLPIAAPPVSVSSKRLYVPPSLALNERFVQATCCAASVMAVLILLPFRY